MLDLRWHQFQWRIAPERLKIVLAFLVVCLVWGSTYVAVRFALESMPPFLMGAIRFFTAGLALYAWMRLRGVPRPEKAHLLPTLLVGILVIGFGTTSVALAEKYLPSGMVSLLVATMPVNVVLLRWLKPGGSYPGGRVVAGLFFAIVGLVVLLGPAKVLEHGSNLWAVVCVFVGSLGAAIGALYARSAKLPPSPQLATGMQMIFVGVVLFAISLITGELTYISQLHLSLKSLLALLFLIVFSSMLAFSAYAWLLKSVDPAKVSTYAYINPIVAIVSGCIFAGEGMTLQSVVGAVIVLGAVCLISQARSHPILKQSKT
jgi:drug/metabolite transporter (DMT)-like permease